MIILKNGYQVCGKPSKILRELTLTDLEIKTAREVILEHNQSSVVTQIDACQEQ